MINELNARKLCKDDISMIENYDKAVNDATQTWHCHHRLETDEEHARPMRYLMMCNMYFHRPASELIFLTPAEHQRVHCEYSRLHKKKPKAKKKGRPRLKRPANTEKKENLA